MLVKSVVPSAQMEIGIERGLSSCWIERLEKLGEKTSFFHTNAFTTPLRTSGFYSHVSVPCF